MIITNIRTVTAITSIPIRTGTRRKLTGHSEESVPPARLDRRFGRSRSPCAAPDDHRRRTRSGRFSCDSALLVLPIIREPLWALMYLSVFGAGAVAGA